MPKLNDTILELSVRRWDRTEPIWVPKALVIAVTGRSYGTRHEGADLEMSNSDRIPVLETPVEVMTQLGWLEEGESDEKDTE